MMTKSRAFIDLKFIKPYLRYEPAIPLTWGKQFTTVQPNRPILVQISFKFLLLCIINLRHRHVSVRLRLRQLLFR